MRLALLKVTIVALVAAQLAGCHLSEPPQAFKRPPKTYHTVISLSPSTTEILESAVQVPALAGRGASDDFPVGAVNNIPIVASLKPDYERIATIRPDLIVYDASLYNDKDVAKLRQVGADMFALTANTYDDYKLQLFKLGSLLAGESHVSDYIDRVNIALSKGSKPNPSPKVAVIIPSVNGDDMIDGTDSFLADIIKRCGGTPVGPKGPLFVKLSPEELIQENPDVVITAAPKKDVSATVAFMKDPRFQTVKAIKETVAHPDARKIVPIESDVLLRRGSRVDNLVDAVYRAVTG